MVLNQRQVLVIVSDWEPYLGSLFCGGVSVWLFPVFVFSAPDRAVLGFATFVVLELCSCLVSHIKHHELDPRCILVLLAFPGRKPLHSAVYSISFQCESDRNNSKKVI